MVHGAEGLKQKFLHFVMRIDSGTDKGMVIYDNVLEPLVEGLHHIREFAKVKYIPGLEMKVTAMLLKIEKELEK